jgi:hypothetical protein
MLIYLELAQVCSTIDQSKIIYKGRWLNQLVTGYHECLSIMIIAEKKLIIIAA